MLHTHLLLTSFIVEILVVGCRTEVVHPALNVVKDSTFVWQISAAVSQVSSMQL